MSRNPLWLLSLSNAEILFGLIQKFVSITDGGRIYGPKTVTPYFLYRRVAYERALMISIAVLKTASASSSDVSTTIASRAGLSGATDRD